MKTKSVLNNYFKKHSKGFGVSVGIFKEQNKRKATNSKVIKGAYGLKKQLAKARSKATNFQVASKNIKGYSGKKFSVPPRNFFLHAKDKKFYRGNNFAFLKEFYKKSPDLKDCTNRLGNLGKVILKKSINDSKAYPENTEFTENLKGFNKPLVFSGQLQKAIQFRKFGGAK